MKSSRHRAKGPTAETVTFALRSRHFTLQGANAPSSLPSFSARDRMRTPASVALGGVLAALFVLTVFLGLCTTSAFAGQARLFAGSFGSASVESGNTPDPYPLEHPTSVAVDTSGGPSNGDVYVTDPANHRVEKFDSSGHFLLMFGKEVNKTALEQSRASETDVCPAPGHPGDVCQPGTQATTPGAFAGSEFSALYLAVDTSGGPSNGDLYVADPADNLVSKFDSSGNLISAWATGGQLDGSGAPEGPFHNLCAIAVDHSGNLWVLDQGPNTGQNGPFTRVFEFRQDSSFLVGWNTENEVNQRGLGGAELGSLALDPEDNLYFLEPNGGPAVKYTPAGVRVGRLTALGSGTLAERLAPYALALDPGTEDLYLAASIETVDFNRDFVQRYPLSSCAPAVATCEVAETFGQGRLGTGEATKALAIDPTSPSDTLYAVSGSDVTALAVEAVPDVTTAKASGFNTGSAILNGTVNPSGVALTECVFQWGETTEPYEHEAPCEPSAASIPVDSNSHPVKAQIAGLQPGHTYHFRLLAGNANTALAEEPRLGQDLSFGPPRLLSASALAASSSTATLQAQLNPENLQTTYHFEYDTVPYGEGEAAHGTATPDASAGSGASDFTGTALLQGLASGTVYHYRLVAENALGAVTGPDHTLTTQPTAALGLPDHRAWELVSPPEKGGATLEAIAEEGAVIQAAADGSALTYVANGSMDAGAPGNRGGATLSQFLANRTPAAWTSQDITPPHEEPLGFRVGHRTEYRLFSPDLSLAAIDPDGRAPLSPATTEPTPYLRHDAAGEYQPLLTASNVQPGAIFGGSFSPEGGFVNEADLDAASPDLQAIVLSSCARLTPEVTERCQDGVLSPRELFAWRHGEIASVSILPNDTPAQAAGLSPEVGGDELLRNAVSTDGSRVIFTARSGNKKALYLRDLEQGEAVRLDSPQGGAPGGGTPFFQDASADASRVFFTDAARLTADSTAQPGKPDLYMCEVALGEAGLACTLKDLTVDHNPGEAADVWPITLAAAADGSSIYFVAKGALAAGATPAACLPEAGSDPAARCNLYRADTATGALRLVSAISSGDLRAVAGSQLNNVTARVSPNGRFFAFMSSLGLTGYDNRDAGSGQPDEEVYLYDAAADEGEGKLLCASCNPTGARPRGVFDKVTGFGVLLVDHAGTWGGKYPPAHWLAASIPGWTSFSVIQSLYQSRYLSDSGRLFFNAADSLVPGDSNGVEDVYEFEPPGAGDCTETASSFARADGGCISLISSGTSPEESAFLDASESGNDVFFLTASRLTPRDEDTALDVYDARSGGGFPEPVKPVECSGDACQQPATPPNDSTPGSLTFSGAGNVLECPKGKVKKSGKCVARKHKKSHKKKHRKHKRTASHNRRTSR